MIQILVFIANYGNALWTGNYSVDVLQCIVSTIHVLVCVM